MSSDNPLDERLRALLRAGDPAEDEAGLSREESAHLRRVVLRNVRSPQPTRWLPLTAVAAAGLLAAVLLLPQRVSPPSPADEAPIEIAGEGPREAARQIHFATERGTQIIWVLDPDLDL